MRQTPHHPHRIAPVLALAAALVLALVLPAAVHAAPPVVQVTGKLIDRVCTVDDDFGLQPAAERRCTLWMREATPGSDGVYRVYTIYCPNKAVDGQPLNLAYSICRDPYGMQINHPNRNYIITGWLRTTAQAADGLGQIQGYQFQT